MRYHTQESRSVDFYKVNVPCDHHPDHCLEFSQFPETIIVSPQSLWCQGMPLSNPQRWFWLFLKFITIKDFLNCTSCLFPFSQLCEIHPRACLSTSSGCKIFHRLVMPNQTASLSVAGVSECSLFLPVTQCSCAFLCSSSSAHVYRLCRYTLDIYPGERLLPRKTGTTFY